MHGHCTSGSEAVAANMVCMESKALQAKIFDCSFDGFVHVIS
jgi:hypothetical protein